MTKTIDIHQQIACVTREIALRKRVYQKRVKEGYMTSADAAYEIAAMEAVLHTLRNEAQPDLPML